MRKLTRSWQIFCKSLTLIGKEKKLLIFPLLSACAMLLLLVFIIAGIAGVICFAANGSAGRGAGRLRRLRHGGGESGAERGRFCDLRTGLSLLHDGGELLQHRLLQRDHPGAQRRENVSVFPRVSATPSTG